MKDKVISINDVKRQTAGGKGDAERTMNILAAQTIRAVMPGRGAELLPYDAACEYRSTALKEDFLHGVVLEDDLGNCVDNLLKIAEELKNNQVLIDYCPASSFMRPMREHLLNQMYREAVKSEPESFDSLLFRYDFYRGYTEAVGPDEKRRYIAKKENIRKAQHCTEPPRPAVGLNEFKAALGDDWKLAHAVVCAESEKELLEGASRLKLAKNKIKTRALIYEKMTDVVLFELYCQPSGGGKVPRLLEIKRNLLAWISEGEMPPGLLNLLKRTEMIEYKAAFDDLFA